MRMFWHFVNDVQVNCYKKWKHFVNHQRYTVNDMLFYILVRNPKYFEVL